MADIRTRHEKKRPYQVRFVDLSTKTGFGYKSFMLLKKARVFAANKELEENNLSFDRSIQSVEQAVNKWLDICETIGRDGREPVEPETLVEYVRRANIIKKYNWREKLQDLRSPDIVKFRNWLLKNFSRDLARRTLSSFHSILIEMNLQGYMNNDPATGITIKTGGRYEGDKGSIEIPSEQEMRDILGAANIMGQKNAFMEKCWARYRPMIYLPIFSGMRSSEFRGLPWVNLFENLVKVTQRADKKGRIGPVKSRAGRRSIELSSKVTDIIFEWKDRCPDSEYDLVFPTASGRPIFLINFREDAWIPLLKEADLMITKKIKGKEVLRPKYTPHAMRHYYASNLISKNKDIKFIQDRMGHSSAEITLDVYGRLMKGQEEIHKQTADEIADQLIPY